MPELKKAKIEDGTVLEVEYDKPDPRSGFVIDHGLASVMVPCSRDSVADMPVLQVEDAFGIDPNAPVGKPYPKLGDWVLFSETFSKYDATPEYDHSILRCRRFCYYVNPAKPCVVNVVKVKNDGRYYVALALYATDRDTPYRKYPWRMAKTLSGSVSLIEYYDDACYAGELIGAFGRARAFGSIEGALKMICKAFPSLNYAEMLLNAKI